MHAPFLHWEVYCYWNLEYLPPGCAQPHCKHFLGWVLGGWRPGFLTTAILGPFSCLPLGPGFWVLFLLYHSMHSCLFYRHHSLLDGTWVVASTLCHLPGTPLHLCSLIPDLHWGLQTTTCRPGPPGYLRACLPHLTCLPGRNHRFWKISFHLLFCTCSAGSFHRYWDGDSPAA